MSDMAGLCVGMVEVNFTISDVAMRGPLLSTTLFMDALLTKSHKSLILRRSLTPWILHIYLKAASAYDIDSSSRISSGSARTLFAE